jgi:thioredoxin reductase
MRDTLAPDCNIRHRPILMQQIDKGVQVHLNTAGLRITDQGLVVKNPDGQEELIPADTVICAVGQRANRADVEALRFSAPFVREVGDCIRPANITKAVYEGYHAALDI